MQFDHQQRGLRLWLALLALGIALLLGACAPGAANEELDPGVEQEAGEIGTEPAVSRPESSHGGAVQDHVSFIDALRAAGAQVEPAGSASQPFFPVEGQLVRVNGATVQVFQFEDAQVAREAAATIGENGQPPAMLIDWGAPPHFFLAERIIVLYVGADAAVLDLLTRTLGSPFASGGG